MMETEDAFVEIDNVMQMAREVFDTRHKFDDDAHKAMRVAPSIDPSMLLADEDSLLANCKDCGKRGEMCVCSAIDDALLDTLIQQVSVPNLAALYQKAQAQGLVKPMYHYQSNS